MWAHLLEKKWQLRGKCHGSEMVWAAEEGKTGWEYFEIFYSILPLEILNDLKDYELALREVRKGNDGFIQARWKEHTCLAFLLVCLYVH